MGPRTAAPPVKISFTPTFMKDVVGRLLGPLVALLKRLTMEKDLEGLLKKLPGMFKSAKRL